MAAGSIVIDLLMRTGAFETDTKRAEKRLAALGKEAQRVGKVIGTAIAGGAIAVATGLTAMVKSAIDSADAIRDLSIRTGVSTETLSAFGYAASQTGTDIDTLAKGMKVLAKNVADSLNPTSEQSKVFKALGIEVKDAQGNLRDIGDLIPEIADRFKVMEDGTTKAALAQALFGRAGLELTEFLNQGSSGLAEFTDRARELGIVLDSDTAAAADSFNDTLGDLKAVTQGYALALAKELLPDLQSLADSFRDTATEGNKVKDMAQGTADFLRGLATVAHIVSSAFEIVGTGIATIVAQGQAAVKFLSGDLSGAVALWREASLGLDAEIDEALGRGGKTGPFANVRSSASRTVSPLPSVDTAAIGRALSNPTAPKASKGGKSDEQKEADQLARAYESLIESQNEQIALHGQTTEAARVRYDVEQGGLTALTESQKALAIQNAEHIDMLDDIAAHEELVAEIAKDQAEEQKRLTEHRQEVLDTIRDEIGLVGMSADQQEVWNNLKWAGVEAESEWGKKIIASTEDLQRQRDAMDDHIEGMDAIRDAGKGLFRDLVDGSKSWKEAFMDALDSIQDRILDMIAENLMDQLFGKQGDPAGGSTGGWFTDVLGAFFGGGKASGGDVMANRAYLIGEQGPEMFVPRTAGVIVPAGETASLGKQGGGVSVTQMFINPVMSDRNSEAQRAQEAGMKIRMAARNS
jgi:uncharacterized phage infection (PIP) family protein YhgE